MVIEPRGGRSVTWGSDQQAYGAASCLVIRSTLLIVSLVSARIWVELQLLGEGAAVAPAAAVTQPRFAMYAVGASTGRQGSSYHFSSPHRLPFAASGAQAMAAPKAGAIEVASQIVRSQGFSGLFSGVSATALRQVRDRSSQRTRHPWCEHMLWTAANTLSGASPSRLHTYRIGVVC